MAKSKLKPSTGETFAIGKLEGHREALIEIKELITQGASLETLKIYVKAKLNTLTLHSLTNPFKQKD